MVWDFETEPLYQETLDWAAEFVEAEVEPLVAEASDDDLWPTQHLPKRLVAARAKFAERLEHELGNL